MTWRHEGDRVLLIGSCTPKVCVRVSISNYRPHTCSSGFPLFSHVLTNLMCACVRVCSGGKTLKTVHAAETKGNKKCNLSGGKRGQRGFSFQKCSAVCPRARPPRARHMVFISTFFYFLKDRICSYVPKYHDIDRLGRKETGTRRRARRTRDVQPTPPPSLSFPPSLPLCCVSICRRQLWIELNLFSFFYVYTFFLLSKQKKKRKRKSINAPKNTSETVREITS